MNADASKTDLSCDKKKVKHKSKKKGTQAKEGSLGPNVENETESKQSETPWKPNAQNRLLLGVLVHHVDEFMNFPQLSVKVHLVDSDTGYYVKKEERCHRGRKPAGVEYILPMMTQPFDLKKSSVPMWEEQITFNKHFRHFIERNDGNPDVLLFFELVSSVSPGEGAEVDVDKHGVQPRAIAWAFLQIVGTDGVPNTDVRLNLQLYLPPPLAPQSLSSSESPEVYEWWRFHPRTEYPSALCVTVRGVDPPGLPDLEAAGGKPEPVRGRGPQPCQIPNKLTLLFHGGQMGCILVLFSPSGTMLAAACMDRETFPVVLYEIPSGRVLTAFFGHFKVIHDLCWSSDDASLLSASSDGTVKEWNVAKLCVAARRVLAHPCFVHSARYHPAAQDLVLTGGQDAKVRVWRLDGVRAKGRLLVELEGHRGFVNTICFDAEGNKMFSADSTGLIIVWEMPVVHDQRLEPHRQWNIERKIAKEGLSDIPINMLQVHPDGCHLLIHAKDNVLRMMDLNFLLMKEYTRTTDKLEMIFSTFTPCGRYIFSGGEDGRVYVWNTGSGTVAAIYSELWNGTGVHGVAFHPHGNMVAFCAIGQTIHVYVHDPRTPQMGVQSTNAGTWVLAPGNTRTTDDTTKTPATPDTSASSANLFGQTRLALKFKECMKHLDSVLGEHQISTQVGIRCKNLFRKDLSEEEKLYKGQFRLQRSGETQKLHSELTDGEESMRQQVLEREDDFKTQLSSVNQCWDGRAQQWTQQKAELEKILMEREEAWRLKEEENKKEIHLLQQEILFLQELDGDDKKKRKKCFSKCFSK